MHLGGTAVELQYMHAAERGGVAAQEVGREVFFLFCLGRRKDSWETTSMLEGVGR